MPLRPCLDCGRPSSGSRCTTHRQVADRVRRGHRDHSWAERRRRENVVAAWRSEYGDWCPGWQVQAHPSADLTADHIVSAMRAGTDGGTLAVLCRPCNSRKRDH